MKRKKKDMSPIDNRITDQQRIIDRLEEEKRRMQSGQPVGEEIRIADQSFRRSKIEQAIADCYQQLAVLKIRKMMNFE